MSLFVNDTQIFTGEINMCLHGIWYSDLRLNGQNNPFNAGDNVTIRTNDNSFSLVGTIAPDRIGELLNVIYVRIIGGAGGMNNTATANAFQNGLVSDVLNSLIKDSGEKLSDTIDQTILNTNLSNWTIIGTSVCYQLNMLTNAMNWNWRFLPDGTLWVGEETYPENNTSSSDYVVLDHDLINGLAVLGVTNPFLIPGYTLDGYQASKVVHELRETSIRTRIYQPQTAGDRSVLTAINALIDNKLAPIDFYAQYTAKVISQSSDLHSVDIQPDDTRLPGMQKIPFSSGLGGTDIKIGSNAKVLLGWASGNPLNPYCTIQAGQDEIIDKMIFNTTTELDLGGSGGDNVATKQDLTDLITAIGTSLTSATGGAVSWTTTPTATGSQTVKATR